MKKPKWRNMHLLELGTLVKYDELIGMLVGTWSWTATMGTPAAFGNPTRDTTRVDHLGQPPTQNGDDCGYLVLTANGPRIYHARYEYLGNRLIEVK